MVPPPRSAAATSSARWAKSEARMENASSITWGCSFGEFISETRMDAGPMRRCSSLRAGNFGMIGLVGVGPELSKLKEGIHEENAIRLMAASSGGAGDDRQRAGADGAEQES